MRRLDFGRPTACPAPLVAHALYDNDVDVVNGDIAEAVHDRLPTEPEPETVLPLGGEYL